MKRLKLLGFAFVLITALAAAHLYEVVNGVHFKGGGAIDFGQPPARESEYLPPGDGMDSEFAPWRPGTVYLLDDTRQESDAAEKQGEILTAHAHNLELAGKFEQALASYESMDRHRQGDSGFIRERIAVLRAGLQRGDRRGMAAYVGGKASSSAWLRPFYMYDALLAQQPGSERGMKFASLALQLQSNLSTLPPRMVDDPWLEPTLMMAARDFLMDTPNGKSGFEPPAKGDISAGVRVLNHLRTNRKGRFYSSATGWLARARYLQGDYLGALAIYWQQLKLESGGEARLRVLDSICMCETALKRRGRAAFADFLVLDFIKDPNRRDFYFNQVAAKLGQFTSSDAKAFWACLKTSPPALSAYLDYRLDRSTVTPDLLALSASATFEGPYAGHIYGRLAEAAYRLRRLPAVLAYCEKCLATSTKDDDRGLATYLQASVAQRQGQRAQAMAGYEEVLRRYRKSYVAGGARENLALLYEHAGRLGDALDMYYALGYQHDVAYMLDIRMSTDQIEAYLGSHPRHDSRDVIRYSLGLRYLRQHRFAEATRAFTLVPDGKRKAYLQGSPWMDEGVTPMRDPLLSTRDLALRYEAAAKAHGSEAKAKALLSIGNYYYNHRDLLLYNARLWHFERSVSIGWSWNDSVATSEDVAALQRHHDEHECLAQAMQVFDELLRMYPTSSSAQRAAYRDACAAWRLANFSPYWRWVADRGNLHERAVNLMHLASTGADKNLAKTAHKFAGVFLEEANDNRANFKESYKNGVPPRRWNPTW